MELYSVILPLEPFHCTMNRLYEVIQRNGQQQLIPSQISGVLPDQIDATEPAFIHDLHHAIRLQSRLESDLPVSLKATTWFINHERFPQCTYGRDVLSPNPQHWLAQILRFWSDVYDPTSRLKSTL